MKKRYAIVGVSHRAISMFINPILGQYKDVAEVVAYVDIAPDRIKRLNELKETSIPAYTPEQFDAMVAETRPEAIIVTTIDASHHTYVIKALEHNLDVYCEKPLTTDSEKCRAILAADAKSTGTVAVTFNMRYVPAHTKIRELIQDGRIGKVVSVDMNYYVDTYHGATYFMRWNRKRECSGGLNVHKSTHHLDLIRWWIDQKPVEVVGYGTRNFFGPDGPRNPSKKDGRVCPNCEERDQCDYYTRWHRDEWRTAPAEAADTEENASSEIFSHYTSPAARRCIYDSEIDIEDTYSAMVKYDGGAIVSYTMVTSAPFEGYRLGINGLNGRIEYETVHERSGQPIPEGLREDITLIEMFGARHTIRPVSQGGSHGGGDPLLQDDMFRGRDESEKVVRMAPLEDGILSVLTGAGIHQSIAEKRHVTIAEMLEG